VGYVSYSIASDTFDILQASNANNPNFIFNLSAGNWYVFEFYGAAGLSYQSQVHGCTGCVVGSGPQAPGFKPHVGDNYAVYNPPSGSPCTFANSGNIAVSSSLNLGTINFSNSCTLTGIGGDIDYTGTGAVGPSNQLYIANYAGTDTQYTTPLNIRNVSLNGFRYDLLDLGLSGTYLIQAWYDSNGNGGSGPTAGEPVTQLGAFTVGTVNALNLILSNANTEPGSPTPTPTATATFTVTPTPTITFTPNPSNTVTSTPTITGTFICTVVETAVPVTISTSANSFGTAANVGSLNALSDLVVAGQTTAIGTADGYFQFTANFTGPVSFYVDCFDDGSGTHLDQLVVDNSSQAYLGETGGAGAVQGSLFNVTSGQSYYGVVVSEIGSAAAGTYKAHFIGQPVPTSTPTSTITSTPNISNTPTSTATYICAVAATATPVAIPPTAGSFTNAVALGALNLSSDMAVTGQLNFEATNQEYFSFIPSYSGTVSCYMDCFDSGSGANDYFAEFYNASQEYQTGTGAPSGGVEKGSLSVTAGQTYYGEVFASTGAGSYKVRLVAPTPTPTFTVTSTPTWTASPTLSPTYVCTVVEASTPVTITALNSGFANAYNAGTLNDGNDLVVWGQNIPGQNEYFKFTANSSVTLTTYLDCFDSGNGSHLYQAAYYNASPTPTFISEDSGGTGPVEGPAYLPVTAGQTYYGVIQDSAGAGAFKAHVIAPPPSWKPVGSYGFSSGAAAYTSLALNSSNVPYVAYQDAANGNKATVMMYTGTGATGWMPVGNPDFSAGAVTWVSMVFDGSGNLYVAYSDGGLGGNASVMECSGCGAGTGTWTSFFTTPNYEGGPDPALYPSMAGSNNTLYLAYADSYNNEELAVLEYDGSNWITVGAGLSNPNVTDISLSVDNTGDPFVAYDANSSSTEVIRLFPEPVTIGVLGPPFQGIQLSLASYNTIPYLTSYGTNGLSVEDCAGCGAGTGAWTEGPQLDSFSGVIYSTSAFEPLNNSNYLAIADPNNGNKADVFKTNLSVGGGWGTVGNPDFSPGATNYESLAFDSNGNPYIAFEDGGNGNQATVMTYH
jgi:hypothetical protein